MNYSNYKNSRDEVWRLLIKNKICTLPVKVSVICRNEGIKVISYKEGEDFIVKNNLKEQCANNDGFSFGNIIFYNEECSVGRKRFSVAHELGHIKLKTKSIQNTEPSEEDDEAEFSANIFASRLLAPACVMWGLNVKKAEEIEKLCNISRTAANFRMQRLEILYKREKEFIIKNNKSCFLLSKLEKSVYNQFKQYIEENKIL